MNFPFTDYSNPADYLTDISANSIVDNRKSKANCFTLAKEWRKSDKYIALMKRLNPELFFVKNGSRTSGTNTANSSRGNSHKNSSNKEPQSPMRRCNTDGESRDNKG